MERIIGILAAVVLLTGLAAVASAGDGEGPNFTFGASTSFVYDFNDPDPPVGPGLNAASYANLESAESFNIDMVQIGVTGQRGPVTYGATIDFGDLAVWAGDDIAGDVGLQTAWIGYELDNLGFTAGRFGTPIGYEVLEPWGNAQISRSWGWQAQPINHDGVQVHGSVGPVDLMAGAVNGFYVTDPAGNDTNDEKGAIWSAGTAISDALNLYFSGIYTDDGGTDRLMFNAIVSGDVPMPDEGPALSYAIEGNWRNDDPSGPDSTFWNIGGYVSSSIGKAMVALRADYSDDEAIVTGANTTLWSVTLTGGYTIVDGVDFRVEYRHDGADDPVFVDGVATDDSLDTIQAQLIWHPEL